MAGFIAGNTPVPSPSVPYSARIPAHLHEGCTISIHGAVQPDCQQFRVDLCCGGSAPGDQTVFVYNPRFYQDEVVRNSADGGDWGDEEKDGGMPFTAGASFHLTIRVEDDGYKVYVNNSYHCSYAHRQAYQSVDALGVDGGVDIHDITIHEKVRVRASNVPLPFVAPYPGGLRLGTLVVIRAQVHGDPAEFRIDLTCGMHDGADVAYVFNPRWRQDEVVRNTCLGGDWGEEEKEGGFPFAAGDYFDMRIQVEYNQFKVTINGAEFPGYSHRHHPLDSIDCVKIEGDLDVHEVSVQ